MVFWKTLIWLSLFLQQTYSLEDSKKQWLNKMEALRSIIDKNDYLKRPLETQVTRSTGTNDFGVGMECTPEPRTVHSLRPQDIDLIGAMGDSITAGSGAKAETIAGIASDDRGVSWSVGGEGTLNDSLTLTNILREFNPQIKGYSLGSGFLSQDWFNVAVPGARARNMPAQALDLLDKMMNDTSVNFENDWKLISLFIGGNDLCAMGRDWDDASPTAYRDYIEEALDILHQGLPRAMISIIDILEIYLMKELPDGHGASPTCRVAQIGLCNHVVSADENETAILREHNKQYQMLVQDLVDSGKYDTHDDFTVVIQPFFRDTVLPRTEDGEVDATYFAPDCFHFSTKGHAMGALNIWNNMMEPVGNKSTVWNITDLKCPSTDNPFIFTRLNSGNENGSGQEPTTSRAATTTTPKKTTTRSFTLPTRPPNPTTTTSSVITTTMPPPTSSTSKPPTTTCKPQECSVKAPDWVIATISVLCVTVLLQSAIVVMALRKRSASSRSFNLSGSFDSMSDTKM